MVPAFQLMSFVWNCQLMHNYVNKYVIAKITQLYSYISRMFYKRFTFINDADTRHYLLRWRPSV